MSVSSINPYLAALYAQNSAIATSSTSGTSTDKQTSSSSSVQGTSGLDSFELSAPPISFPGYDSSGNSTDGSNLKADIKAFLAKVKNGTVTQDDIQKLEAELKQAAQASGTQTASSTSSTSSSSSDLRSDVKNFLDKVKDGSVTQSDLQSMQTELKQAAPPSDAAQGAGNSDFKSFMDKVANGTVTSTDLQKMQTQLQQMQKAGGAHGHHHHGGGDSSSSFGSDLSSFMDKVANGTVTDTDLQSMQSELQQQQQQTASS